MLVLGGGMLLPPCTSRISHLSMVLLFHLLMYLPLLRISPGDLSAEILKADLHRLHVLQELVQRCHVQLGLEIDFIGNLLDLWQI